MVQIDGTGTRGGIHLHDYPFRRHTCRNMSPMAHPRFTPVLKVFRNSVGQKQSAALCDPHGLSFDSNVQNNSSLVQPNQLKSAMVALWENLTSQSLLHVHSIYSVFLYRACTSLYTSYINDIYANTYIHTYIYTHVHTHYIGTSYL